MKANKTTGGQEVSAVFLKFTMLYLHDLNIRLAFFILVSLILMLFFNIFMTRLGKHCGRSHGH